MLAKGKGSKGGQSDDSGEADYDPEADANERMEKSVTSCSDALSGIRTGALPCTLAQMQPLHCVQHAQTCHSCLCCETIQGWYESLDSANI